MPPAVIGFAENDADAPDGSPEADSVTLCALPDVTAVEIVEVADAPGLTLADAGLSLMEKSLAETPPDSVTSSYSVYVGSPG